MTQPLLRRTQRGLDDELVVLSGSLDNLALLDEIMVDALVMTPDTRFHYCKQRVRTEHYEVGNEGGIDAKDG